MNSTQLPTNHADRHKAQLGSLCLVLSFAIIGCVGNTRPDKTVLPKKPLDTISSSFEFDRCVTGMIKSGLITKEGGPYFNLYPDRDETMLISIDDSDGYIEVNAQTASCDRSEELVHSVLQKMDFSLDDLIWTEDSRWADSDTNHEDHAENDCWWVTRSMGTTDFSIELRNKQITDENKGKIENWLRRINDFLATANTIKLISLQPTFVNDVETNETFHGWKVIGSAELETRTDLDTIREFVKLRLREKVVFMNCFEPRHAIRATIKNRQLDLVICFECVEVQAWLDGDQESFNISDSEPLNQILREHNIPISASKKHSITK